MTPFLPDAGPIPTPQPPRWLVSLLAGYIATMKATIEFAVALYRRLKVEAAWRPAWFGSLGTYAAAVDDHSMSAVKRSIIERP